MLKCVIKNIFLQEPNQDRTLISHSFFALDPNCIYSLKKNHNKYASLIIFDKEEYIY